MKKMKVLYKLIICYFTEMMQRDNNHPVHVIDEEGNLSKSAFIPFCEFAGNLSVMGEKIDEFQFPICNSFKPRVMNDQLCYEVDLSKFCDKNNIEKELEIGFNFLMDYNEDRQVTYDNNNNEEREFSLGNSVVASDQNKHAFIYLDTIGKILRLWKQQFKKL